MLRGCRGEDVLLLQLFVTVVLFSILESPPCEGVVVSWTNPLGGSWGEASNWNTSAVPVATDEVHINVPKNSSARFNITLNGASYTIASLYFLVPYTNTR